MSMSKKDYVAVAETLNAILWMEQSCPLTIARMTAALGVVFTEDNPKFDEERFRAVALSQKSGYTKFKEERARLGI
jgi:hypothetical protein